jgi:hypothetical protein
MSRWFRYVPYDALLCAMCSGWQPVADLGEHHGQYAVLCRWTREGEPQSITE